MRVMVCGGSGFVGRAVVEGLRARGHGVRVLTRGTRSAMAGVEWVTGGVGDAGAMARACEGSEAVVYLAGIIAEVGDQTYDWVHREGVERVLGAARAAGVGRWVQMSALGTRPGARSRYHQTKWAGEEAVRGSGMAWTIFRPSLIHGEGDGFLGFFERMSRWSPVLPVMGRPDALFQPVWVGDVARAFASAMEARASEGKVYDLCGPGRWTMRGMLGLMLRVTGRRRLLAGVPGGAAWFQAWVAEKVVGGWVGRTPPLCRDQLVMLEEDNVGDAGPAAKELGLEFSGLEERLRDRWGKDREGFFSS